MYGRRRPQKAPNSNPPLVVWGYFKGPRNICFRTSVPGGSPTGVWNRSFGESVPGGSPTGVRNRSLGTSVPGAAPQESGTHPWEPLFRELPHRSPEHILWELCSGSCPTGVWNRSFGNSALKGSPAEWSCKASPVRVLGN